MKRGRHAFRRSFQKRAVGWWYQVRFVLSNVVADFLQWEEGGGVGKTWNGTRCT